MEQTKDNKDDRKKAQIKAQKEIIKILEHPQDSILLVSFGQINEEGERAMASILGGQGDDILFMLIEVMKRDLRIRKLFVDALKDIMLDEMPRTIKDKLKELQKEFKDKCNNSDEIFKNPHGQA